MWVRRIACRHTEAPIVRIIHGSVAPLARPDSKPDRAGAAAQPLACGSSFRVGTGGRKPSNAELIETDTYECLIIGKPRARTAARRQAPVVGGDS